MEKTTRSFCPPLALVAGKSIYPVGRKNQPLNFKQPVRDSRISNLAPYCLFAQMAPVFGSKAFHSFQKVLEIIFISFFEFNFNKNRYPEL